MSAAQEARPEEAEAAFAEGNALWQQGAREAAIDAFHRAVALRPDHAGAQNNLGNALTDCDRPEEALAPYRAALRLQPRNPERHYNLGNALLRMRRGPEAEVCFRIAILLAPGNAAAHNNLGNALRAQKRHEEALASYRRALELRPDFAGTLGNIGNALLSLGRPAEAAEAFGRLTAAQPGNAEGWNCLAGSMLTLARTAEAEAHFRRALGCDPGHAKARFGLALALLRQGRLQEGWEEYESRWDDPGFDPDMPRFTEPLWRGEALPPGTTVLLYAEQGLGDFLQFVRYAPLLRRRGARVLLAVPPGTAPLLRDTADVIVQRGEEIPPFDLRSPLLSLPRAFGTTLATIPAEVPYLHADPARIAAWRERLGPRPAGVRLRAGLAWSGNPDHPNDAMRSIGLARLAPLLGLPGIEWHVVQKDIRAEDGPALEAHPALRRHGEALTDFGETAALMSQLDVVVSVDTSLVHLAGALARPVLVMLPLAADFRWLEGRADSPWYPTVRLFRQAEVNAWDPVIAAVAAALSGR